MAEFLGRLKGNRGAVTRLGDRRSGIDVDANVWACGVSVRGKFSTAGDVFFIYATGGSGPDSRSRLIGHVRVKDGKIVFVAAPNVASSIMLKGEEVDTEEL